MDRRVYLVALFLFVALGSYLRLVDLGGPSLWHDEIIHLQATDSLARQPWHRHLVGIKEVRGWSENGFVYYGFQILGQRLAPGEIGARLFPALFGILALPLMTLCGQLLGGRLVGLAATFLLAVAPLHVYYSREGRPYSLLIFLTLMLLYALLQENRRVRVVLAWLGCLLAAYVGIHSIPVLLSFLAISALSWMREARPGGRLLRSSYLACVLAPVVALVLTYGLYMTRSKLNVVEIGPLQALTAQESSRARQLDSPVHESPLTQRSLQRFLASMTTSGHQSRSLVVRSWLLLGVALLGVFAGRNRQPRRTLATAAMFGFTVVLSMVALVSVDRFYGLRYTSTALPPFLLLAASGIVFLAQGSTAMVLRGRGPAGRRVVGTVMTVLLLGALAAPSVVAARVDPQRKLDWRGIAHFFDEIALPGEPILMGNDWPLICLGYYLRDLDREVRWVNLWESAETGATVVQQTPGGWLLTAGFRKTDEVRLWMHGFQPVLKRPEEEMALFFFPDFVTLLETRFAAQKGGLFLRRFEELRRRFEFDGTEMLLQGSGWSFPESNSAGTDYQWAMGPVAELGLPLEQARPSRLRFRVLPFQFSQAPPQTLRLRLNKTLLAIVELDEGWSEHEIEVPQESWRSGANLLFLEFARSTAPAQVVVGSQDSRPLSVAFDYLELIASESQQRR